MSSSPLSSDRSRIMLPHHRLANLGAVGFAMLSVFAVLAAERAWVQEVGEKTSSSYEAPRTQGTLPDTILESSGLARSWTEPGSFWTLNDSGNPAELYLIDLRGNLRATVPVSNATSVDWEDLCSFQHEGKNYLLVADVGDNGRRRPHVQLHLIEEPEVEPADRSHPACRPVGSLRITYENGPRDCEGVAVDVAAGTIYLFTKTLGVRVAVYSVPLNQVLQAEPVGSYEAPVVGHCSVPLITAADISADGERLVCTTYSSLYQWTRTPGQRWQEVFSSQPEQLPAPARRQGEAVCFSHDDRGLVLTSEGREQPVWLSVPTTHPDESEAKP